jgi:hypothetical protein
MRHGASSRNGFTTKCNGGLAVLPILNNLEPGSIDRSARAQRVRDWENENRQDLEERRQRFTEDRIRDEGGDFPLTPEEQRAKHYRFHCYCAYKDHEADPTKDLPKACPMGLPAEHAMACPFRDSEDPELRFCHYSFGTTRFHATVKDTGRLRDFFLEDQKLPERERRYPPIRPTQKPIDGENDMATATLEAPEAIGLDPTEEIDELIPVRRRANSVKAADFYQRYAEFAPAIDSMGKLFHECGFIKCNPAAGKVLAISCVLSQMDPMDFIREFIREYHIVDGKLSRRADVILADFQRAGGQVEWVNIGDDGQAAVALWTFGNDDQNPGQEIGFSIEEAKAAKLVKPDSNWQKNPGAMLRARLICKAVRIKAPQILGGLYAPEEFGEIPPPVNATNGTNGNASSNGNGHTTQTQAPAPAATPNPGPSKSAAVAPSVAPAVHPGLPRGDLATGSVSSSVPPQRQAQNAAVATAQANGQKTDVTRDQLVKIRDLKTRLGMTDEQYKTALSKLGAQTAMALSAENAGRFIAFLAKRALALPQTPQDLRDELSKWADGATVREQPANGVASGN